MDVEIGTRLVLMGTSKKGKERIRNLTTVWEVLDTADIVLFAPSVKGPWLFVEPLMEDKSKKLRGARWIHGTSDKDFMIVKEV